MTDRELSRKNGTNETNEYYHQNKKKYRKKHVTSSSPSKKLLICIIKLFIKETTIHSHFRPSEKTRRQRDYTKHKRNKKRTLHGAFFVNEIHIHRKLNHHSFFDDFSNDIPRVEYTTIQFS